MDKRLFICKCGGEIVGSKNTDEHFIICPKCKRIGCVIEDLDVEGVNMEKLCGNCPSHKIYETTLMLPKRHYCETFKEVIDKLGADCPVLKSKLKSAEGN